MTPSGSTRRRRQRGEIETLPSGSLRVRVYAGIDPISGKRHYLTEVIPAGKDAAKLAEKARTRMQSQVDERRSPRSKVTVDQLMDRYLDLLDVDVTTRAGYEGYIRNHVRPLLGHLQVGKLDGETLDSFYAILRRCRAHCDGRPFVEHRTASEHTCDAKCRPHSCRPLAASSVRQVHFCLSGALKRAVRWHWIGVNPLEQAEPPRGVKHDPQPPSAEQAAAILNSAFSDVAWGVMIWLAMTTGARRGELCALRWSLVDLDNSVVTIKTSIGQNGKQTWEKNTKTHQQRRITLDENTVMLLRAYRQQCEVIARSLGLTIPPDGRVFSAAPDHTTWLRPSSITQRYSRMCARLGWDMHIHQLRHYSATELISAGVDVRTVAGRLGHGGGGSTTLRVYSAWVSESDQKAAGAFTVRMPAPPIGLGKGPSSLSEAYPPRDSASPYEQIAADLRGAITCGALRVGELLPTVEQLKDRYQVSSGTASRAIAVLKDAGLVTASRGRRASVAEQSESA
ncbi:MAG: tyrosine-type recombinase/integrase [Pseudonocardia sp.]|uniref:tyrosine-type recombinase/integrase n=1 Tax=Pseudonocardia sp. TaxID=60912 RepID=UPI001AC8610C|nr:tyrosine-type recombinase/integrase [Pseudonocardia sp.]MBN9102355.1 tyrosine-type recombinase/integrase [Pseudonocardia sp.]